MIEMILSLALSAQLEQGTFHPVKTRNETPSQVKNYEPPEDINGPQRSQGSGTR